MSLRIVLGTCILSLFLYLHIHSCVIPTPEELPRIGNFALPSSQQPGTLYGFGQNVIDQGDLLVGTTTPFDIGQRNTNFSTVAPYLLYGIRDDTAIFITLPIAAQFNQGCHSSSGLQDATIQIEYIPYRHQTEDGNIEISLVGSLLLPFGNSQKKPRTGYGSPTFFIGTTMRYLSTEWYWFISPGAFFTTTHTKNRAGNTFLYQAGFGKNIGYESDKWLSMLSLELNGICIQKDTQCGILNPNTGSNLVALGPSIWFSTQRFIFQAGISPIVYQHWNGNQAKSTLLINLNFTWKF